MAKKVIESPKPQLDRDAGLVEIGLMVKHVRTKNKMKIEEVCNWLEMSKSTLIKIEKGNETVSARNLFKVLREFGIHLRIQK